MSWSFHKDVSSIFVIANLIQLFLFKVFNDKNTPPLFNFYDLFKKNYGIQRSNYDILRQDIFIFS